MSYFDYDLSPEELYETQSLLAERLRKHLEEKRRLKELEEHSMKVNSLHRGTKE